MARWRRECDGTLVTEVDARAQETASLEAGGVPKYCAQILAWSPSKATHGCAEPKTVVDGSVVVVVVPGWPATGAADGVAMGTNGIAEIVAIARLAPAPSARLFGHASHVNFGDPTIGFTP